MNTALAPDYREESQATVQPKLRVIPPKRKSVKDKSEIEVLFQKIGNKSYAFSSTGDVYFLEEECAG